MRKQLKKVLACIVCLAMIVPMSMAVYSDSEATDEAAAETTEAADESAADPEEEEKVITEEEAFAEMELVTKNSNLELYKSTSRNDTTLCLKDLKSGKLWWSNPINAINSNAKKAQKNELMSGLVLTYAEPANRRTTTVNNKTKGSVSIDKIDNGVKFTYTFSECGITVPVYITLEEDYLKAYINSSEIVEEHPSSASGMLVSNLAVFSTFGAADRNAEGYYVIPDGSGAIINYNNQKTGYKVYSGKVYGNDVTPVKQTKSYKTQNVSFNMYGIVEGGDGLLVVADKGDTAASVNAYVAGENNTDYNACYFSFETRTSDEYLMGGDSNPLKVFEKHGNLVPEIELRYYPVSNDDGSDVDYVDIASKYRSYLTDDCGVKKSEAVSENPLYVDLYGGTQKTESILGIPVTVKKEVTSFTEATDIVTKLNELGVDDMVVNYMDWTGTEIGDKITDSASAASTLGGSSKFKKFMNYADANNITVYPDVDNQTFKSGNGYMTVTNTAIRVSNSYSRQIVYDLAHGVENQYYKSLSLFSPASFEKAFSKLVNGYDKKGLTNISFGSYANSIWGDYGKKAVSREMAKGYVQDFYSNAETTLGSVLADNANAYVLPYVDHVTNIPLSSSKYDLFDAEIPLYQIVLHGYIPYSTTAVNADPDVCELVLRAIASGSNLNFDLIGEEASELKDTKYDKLFYADYVNWLDDAAGCYKLQNDILSEVADQTIVEYNVSEDGNEIETVYSDKTTTVVNLEEKTVKLNGTTYKLADYLTEGVIAE